MPLVCPKCKSTLLVRHSTQDGIDKVSDDKLTIYCAGYCDSKNPCDYEFEVTRSD